MASSGDPARPRTAEAHPLAVILRWLASLKLAVILIVALACVLAWATILESAHGREYAQWYVYKSTWFIGLLALLGVNILAATCVRWPWTKTRSGFVMTHAGLLVLLAGSVQTFMAGIDGRMIVEEGQTGNTVLLTDRSQLTAMWHQDRGIRPAAFSFNAGPVDWPEGKSLDMGELGGIEVRILRFLRHARTEEAWVEDPTGAGGPALKFALIGPGGTSAGEKWLAGGPFGGEAAIGPATFELHRASEASLLEDFTDPPAAEGMDEKGVLSLHYQGKIERFAVSEHLGKEVSLGEGAPRVVIAEYLPAARPGEGGKFVSQGDDAQNPMLELQVYLPDREEPVQQIAFARHPLLNLDAVHAKATPIKFWYHHPAVKPAAGTQFLQTPDGKLHARTAGEKGYQSREVKVGDTMATSAGFQLHLSEFFEHAREEVLFRPVELARGEMSGPEAAVLVEVTAGGKSQQVWLKRNDDTHGFQILESPEGPLAIGFGYERIPLAFSLKLHEFQRTSNPGGMGDASFASSVQLIDPVEEIDAGREISMNEPLVHGKYTFYQSGFHEMPGGKEATVLTVAYDPGRFLKYLGSLMICVGVFFMFYTKANLTRKLWDTLIGRWSKPRRKNEPPSGSHRPISPREDHAAEDALVHAE
ncbi:MAG: hypothetical protein GXY83_10240 [Rhodopirellula sp.]|nr:hypothetical protein [Rhodopirellula sp.]